MLPSVPDWLRGGEVIAVGDLNKCSSGGVRRRWDATFLLLTVLMRHGKEKKIGQFKWKRFEPQGGP